MNEIDERYLRPIRRGEYDLVNISCIGRDPITGRSFEECADAWRAAFDRVVSDMGRVRWWNVAGKLRVGRQLLALRSHQGMG